MNVICQKHTTPMCVEKLYAFPTGNLMFDQGFISSRVQNVLSEGYGSHYVLCYVQGLDLYWCWVKDYKATNLVSVGLEQVWYNLEPSYM